MATTRFDAEKFSSKNDFGLWRIKMRAMLIQQGLADALKPVVKSSEKDKEKGTETDSKSVEIDAQKRAEIMEKAHSTIVLCLTDKVLLEVAKETTATGVLAKLESLYMTKSLANRLYMKHRLYSYKISEDRGLEEQLEEFNKSLDDLENIDVQIEDEDKAIILLNALPSKYDQLKDAMLYGRDSSISLEEVQNALRAKELQKQVGGSHKDSASESLNVKKFNIQQV